MAYLAFFTKLVTLTTTQVENLFGELEYIEPRLRVLISSERYVGFTEEHNKL